MKLRPLFASYHFQAKNTYLPLFSAIKMVRLTLQCGMWSSAPSAFSMYGGIVSGILNDLRAGTHIGEIAFPWWKGS
jgi:hypothetical protein